MPQTLVSFTILMHLTSSYVGFMNPHKIRIPRDLLCTAYMLCEYIAGNTATWFYLRGSYPSAVGVSHSVVQQIV